MLVELSIRDFALIERAELSFGPGLGVVTGETGAGKSLLVGALELLLGRNPRGSLVRQGARQARVDGRFVFTSKDVPERLVAWLAAHLPEVLEEREAGDELELVLGRAIGLDGRTRAYLNHRPVTRKALRELASMLVEIHGQNDHQRLFEPAEQCALVDAFGGLERPLAAYREARARWLALADRLERYERDEAERADRVDLLRFQLAELEDAALDEWSVEQALTERERLRHADVLARLLARLSEDLIEGGGSALERIGGAERELARWAERVAELAAPAADLGEARCHLEEAGAALSKLGEGLDAAPGRLEELEGRLARWEALARKHRVALGDLPDLAQRLAAELVEIEGLGRSLKELEREEREALGALEGAAATLTRARRRLRKRLARAVEGALADLGLERARIELSVQPREVREIDSPNASPAGARRALERRRFGPNGADRVELLLAANPGEGFGPLSAVASGGEAARIMLALRGALAARCTIPTLVFDEVDAGVGGRLAPRVGAHLARLGRSYQVLCVTHLAAVAAAADRHLRVAKRVSRGRTRTEVCVLEGQTRVDEIAEMISGGAGEETALAEARRLLEG